MPQTKGAGKGGEVWRPVATPERNTVKRWWWFTKPGKGWSHKVAAHYRDGVAAERPAVEIAARSEWEAEHMAGIVAAALNAQYA